MKGPQVGERISEYVLEELVGAGSFGQVWRAHHHIWKTDRVAVKVPTDSQFVRNLQREGLTVHGLKHPNIVRAIGLDPYADVPYLVMEYVDGASLDKLIEKSPSGLPIPAVRNFLRGILQALEYAHGANVIHRDIKPANILIVGGHSKLPESLSPDDVKVTDFGLGLAGEITASSIVQSGSLLAEDGKSISGTLAYMAPEQRDGGETDARSDLYSVGVVLFEMVTGKRPSGSDMPSHVREGLPSWIDWLYSRLYTRHERRLASATEALAMIDTMGVPPVIQPSLPPMARGMGGPVRVERDGRAPPPPPIPGPRVSKRSCPSCGGEAQRGDNYCILCGVQIVAEVRKCASCGAVPQTNDRFCITCGSPLQAEIR
ncbi:MAG: serine/threonine-protein kinase [Planctomycetota bacterium]